MRFVLFALGLAAPGLAAAQAPNRITVVRALVGRTDRVIADTMGMPLEVPGLPGPAFAALAAVYEDLKIPAGVRDSAALEVGNEAFVRRGDVGGRRMSASLDCGDSFTGPRADAYRIDLSLISFLTPSAPDVTTLRTVLIGTAVNVTEGGRPTQPCYTTGELEKRIHQMVLKKLAAARP